MNIYHFVSINDIFNILKHYILLSIIISLSGCLNANNSYTQSNHQFTNFDYNLYREPSAECKTKKIYIKDVLTASKLVNKFKKYPILDKRDEFETEEDYLSKKHRTFSHIINDHYYVYSYVDSILFSKIEYDVNTQFFKYSSYNYTPYLFPNYKCYFVISDNYHINGSYVGMNAFGFTKIVDRASNRLVIIEINNSSSIKNFGVNYRDSSKSEIKEIFGYSHKIPVDSAKIMKNNLRIIYDISPEVGTVQYDKLGTFDVRSTTITPTIDMPTESNVHLTKINVKLHGIYLVNIKTSEVIGSICF